MKLTSKVVLVCLWACISIHASAERILPDACGEDSIKFKVTVEKNQSEIPAPIPGKARLVLIESLDKHGVIGAAATTRFGVDGAWVGANKGNSYFVVDVDPGAHHLCVNWQAVNTTGRNVGLASVNAVAGQVYYFEAAIMERAVDAGPPTGPGHRVYTDIGFNFVPVNEDEGRWRLKISGLSTSTSK